MKKINNLNQFPKVPIEITIDLCLKNDISIVKEGWYCLPLINGLPNISNDLLIFSTRQKNLSTAIKCCMVHNTYNKLLTNNESAALLALHAGINVEG